MKKILSLMLTLVMLVLTLASCSYNFSKDDMSNYATFGDAEFKAFKDALLNLAIEDGTFTPTEDGKIREQKLLETIYNTVGKEADLEAKLYEGTVGTYDILYYAYYCTANFEGAENVVLYASNMKEASATKLQLGMVSTAGDLDTAIMEALKDKDIKDYLYKTTVDTETALKYGDKVYVSYTYEYTDAESKVKTVKATYEAMTLTEGDAFSEALITNCEKVATKKDTFKATIDGVERTYKNTIVDWVVTEESKLGEFAVGDFDDTKSVTDVSGTSRKLADITDDTITYHVYPVYFVKAPEFTATLILDALVGANLTKDIFEVFEDESYKTTVDGKEVKLSALVEELAALCKSRDDAETALSTAEKTLTTKQEAVDKAGEEATEAQKQAVTTAQAAVDTAKETLDEAQGKVDAKIADIFKTGTDVEEKIIDGYKKRAEETLENEYNNTIIENIAKEVWALIDGIKVNSLPEKAVNEAYERILENHEYTFYTGTADSSSSTSNYSKYNGSFDAYLIETFAKGKTKADALAAIREQAKEAVTPIVKLYAVAEKYGCVVTDAEYKEDYVKGNSYYDYYVETYGETNLRTVYQFDKLLSTILEVETYEEGDKKGEMKEYVYTEGVTEGKLPFKNIKYEIKAEEDESETE